jgi:hypothetical protein
MADLATIRTRIVEAEEALHQLATGAKEAWVTDHNGESVRYVRTSVGELQRYLHYLRMEEARLAGTGYPGRPVLPMF